MALELREHQLDVVQRLREGFAAGHQCQLMYAPTGFGKTEVAIHIMQQTAEKYNRSSFVVDRIVLAEQTSLRLGKYDIDHGVMQSGHWRWKPAQRIQVCSAQTLEKRKSFPDTTLMMIDEAHIQRASLVKYIRENPQVKVIGLTATPFTKGLGQIYTNVVGGLPTSKLVEQGWLAPLKVFIAKEINMDGAKKVAGEWSSAETTKRGMEITGDVVSEWVKKTHEIYGGPRKTIVFCSGVNHGRDLELQFKAAGHNFVSISYKEDDDFKRITIEEFSKPNSEIMGLIATDILTRGFDVSDVMIGVSARPFSKSFSSHVQQLGRVMRPHPGKEFGLWLCMAIGSQVLTDRGLVAIEEVSLSDKIWDGTNFVTHNGAVCNGIQDVITYQGLTATPGHLVHTEKGWRTFGDCAKEQIRITQTGSGGTAIRISENFRPAGFLAGRKAQEIYSRSVRVCGLWIQRFNLTSEPSGRKNKRMSGVQSAGHGLSNVVVRQGSGNARAVLQPGQRILSKLRRAWDKVRIFWSETRNNLDHGKSWDSGLLFGGFEVATQSGQDRPGWKLRAGELAMDNRRAEPTKQARESRRSENPQIQNRPSRGSLCRQYVEAFFLGWNDGRSDPRKIQEAISQTKREVWDILDAGPNNRFTCEGLLVHNCHSGNYLRFADDWDELYANGVTELDDEGEKAKNEPTEKKKKDAKCQKCGALWVWPGDKCGNCGHIQTRPSMIVTVPGEMMEYSGSKVPSGEKQEVYSQLLHYARTRGFRDGWAAHQYKTKFGVWPRNLDEVPQTPTPQILSWIRSRQIAYAKSRAA